MICLLNCNFQKLENKIFAALNSLLRLIQILANHIANMFLIFPRKHDLPYKIGISNLYRWIDYILLHCNWCKARVQSTGENKTPDNAQPDPGFAFRIYTKAICSKSCLYYRLVQVTSAS